MSLYAIPAIIAFILKIVLLGWALYHGNIRRDWIVFGLVLCFQNIVEILVTVYLNHDQYAEYIIRMYWVGLTSILMLTIYFVAINPAQRLASHALGLLAAGFVVVVLFTDFVIKGHDVSSIQLTAIYGEYSLIYMAWALCVSALVCGICTWNLINAQSDRCKIIAIYQLLAVSPFILITLITQGIYAIGYKPSSLMMVPIGSTIFMLITYFSAAKELIRDPRFYIPGMREYKVNQNLYRTISDYALDQTNLPATLESLEKTLIQYKFDINNGNAQTTAEALGVPRSTFYSKAERLGIKLSRDSKS